MSCLESCAYCSKKKRRLACNVSFLGMRNVQAHLQLKLNMCALFGANWKCWSSSFRTQD